jgi:trigger factor
LVKVNVIEQPACKRVLEIEIPAEDVAGQMEELVEEYRRSMVLPGFRKGKAPREMVRARVGDTLESELLKKVLPKAYMEALEETRVNPAGEPEIRNLQFKIGEPLRFTAQIEVWPDVQVAGYREMSLMREEYEVTDEDVERSLKGFRESRAIEVKVDRPAQGGDVVGFEYWMLDFSGQRGEMKSASIEIGAPSTPEPFNAALMGVHAGESRKVVLPATVHTSEEGVHEHPEQVFEVLVKEVHEKHLPPLDDDFAKAAMGSDSATLDEMKARIRLNLEAQVLMASREKFEEVLFDEILTRNPFELPEGVVTGALNNILENAKKDRGELSEEEESRLRSLYQPAVERRFRTDLVIQAIGRQENLNLTDEEVDQEIVRYAEREGKSAAEVRGRLKRGGDLDRLKDDMFRHKVVQTLLGLMKVDVLKKRR